MLFKLSNRDKEPAVPVARRFAELGFTLAATRNTAAALRAHGLAVQGVLKVGEGHPDSVEVMQRGEIAFLVNTPLGGAAQRDDRSMRQVAVQQRIPYVTTVAAAAAAAEAIAGTRTEEVGVMSVQEWHARLAGR